MNLVEDFAAPVSFGRSIAKPGDLETRPTGWLLEGVLAGRWQKQVERARSGADASDRHRRKLALPFWTPSGTFERRCAGGLAKHSGQVAIDLDGMSESSRLRAFQTAVIDPFCAAAFTSAGGGGMRLIFRTPALAAHQHAAAFRQVADHVRNLYRTEPDLSGSDVSRASFVSFDGKLYANASAEIFPLEIEEDAERLHTAIAACSGSPSSLSLDWAKIGGLFVPHLRKADGTGYTHRSLLDLTKRLAVIGERAGVKITERDLCVAVEAWWKGAEAAQIELSRPVESYITEARTMLSDATEKPWFPTLAKKWTRWRDARGFPKDGPSAAQIMFAIERHCAEQRRKGDPKPDEFYLGAFDAGTIAGITAKGGWLVLQRLVKLNKLAKLPIPRAAREAQWFALVRKSSNSTPPKTRKDT